jgi:hypothetical protein
MVVEKGTDGFIVRAPWIPGHVEAETWEEAYWLALRMRPKT